MTLHKLADIQVVTLLFIQANQPPMPADLDRFPTVKLLLDTGIVVNRDGKLNVDETSEEFHYQDIFPDSYRRAQRWGELKTFEDMERVGLLVFRPNAQSMPEDTFFFYDALILKETTEKLGGVFPPKLAGQFVLPPDADKVNSHLFRDALVTFVSRHSARCASLWMAQTNHSKDMLAAMFANNFDELATMIGNNLLNLSDAAKQELLYVVFGDAPNDLLNVAADMIGGTVHTDNSGQIVIYTGMKYNADGEAEYMPESDLDINEG